MRQIPSQFIDDKDYKKLLMFKEKHNLTWKDLLLLPIKDDDN
jgi:hypothetical protein